MTARLAMLVGLCAWLGGSVAQLVHEAVVTHVVCPEHGEVLELDGQAKAARADASEIRSASPDLHEHACDFELVTFASTVPALAAWTGPAVPALDSHPLARAQAPRGPPLAYAPKTSPPSC